MRILFLCHRAPWPPNKGEKLRSYNQIRLLARRYDVDLVSLADHSNELEGSDLPELCRTVRLFPRSRLARLGGVLKAALDGRALTLGYFDSNELKTLASSGASSSSPPGPYDLVFASTAAMAPFARLVDAPRVIDLMDVDSQKWSELARITPTRRPLYSFESSRMRRWEAQLASHFGALLFVNENERSAYEAIAPHAKTYVVSNGMDLESPLPLVEKTQEPSLVFVGTMSYRPNADGVANFCREVLPSLQRSNPGISFTVVGRDPLPEVRKLGDLPGVTVTGTVPEVTPYLARSWVFVAPHRSAPGLQNKILEAMNAGVPVVCSRACWEGLKDAGFAAGTDLLVADNSDGMAQAIQQLVDHPELRLRLVANARSRARSHYRWDRVGEQLEEVLDDVLQRRTEPAAALTALAGAGR